MTPAALASSSRMGAPRTHGMERHSAGALDHEQDLVAGGAGVERPANVPARPVRVEIGASDANADAHQLDEFLREHAAAPRVARHPVDDSRPLGIPRPQQGDRLVVERSLFLARHRIFSQDLLDRNRRISVRLWRRKGERVGLPDEERRAGRVGDHRVPGRARRRGLLLEDRSAEPGRRVESFIQQLHLDKVHPAAAREGRRPGNPPSRERLRFRVDRDAPVVDAISLLDPPAEEPAVEGRERFGLVAVDLEVADAARHAVKPDAKTPVAAAQFILIPLSWRYFLNTTSIAWMTFLS